MNPLLKNDAILEQKSKVRYPLGLVNDSLSLAILSSLMTDTSPDQQSLSLFSNPDHHKEFVAFLNERWQHYQTKFISNGAYTDSVGNLTVREGVSQFLETRDGVPANVKDIFVLSSLNNAFNYFTMSMIAGPNDCIFIPTPYNNEYVAIAKSTGGSVQNFNLLSKSNTFDIKGLVQTVEACKDQGKTPKVLLISNPGYPSGVLLSSSQINELIEFAAKESMVLLVDESFQEVSLGDSEFVSFKKVLASHPNQDVRESVQLISLHCISHTLTPSNFGGVFAELCNFSEEVYMQFNKAYSISLCSNTIGQISMDLCVRREEYLALLSEPLRQIFEEEKIINIDFLKRNFEILREILESVPNVELIDQNNTFYAFAQLKTNDLDCVSVSKIIEEKTGIPIEPGSTFGMPGYLRFDKTIAITQQQKNILTQTLKSLK
jgi:alanine transaminase